MESALWDQPETDATDLNEAMRFNAPLFVRPAAVTGEPIGSLFQRSFLRRFRSVLDCLQVSIRIIPTLPLGVALQCLTLGKSNLGSALRFSDSRIGYGRDLRLGRFRLGISCVLGKLLRGLYLRLLPVCISLGIVLGRFASCLSYVGLHLIWRFGLVTGAKTE